MNRTRPKQIVIRTTEDEFNKIKKQVEKSGMKQQEYVIKALTNKEIVNTEGLQKIIPEVRRIGTNLNQLTRRANEGFVVEHGEVLQMQKEFDEIWQLLKRLAQELV